MTTTNHSPDWPLISFFCLAYAIAWSCVPVLGAIATNSGAEDWTAFSGMIESWNYEGVEPTAPKMAAAGYIYSATAVPY